MIEAMPGTAEIEIAVDAAVSFAAPGLRLADEMAVNDTVEAVGFDFIRTPELKFHCGTAKGTGELFPQGVIRIKAFKSDAVVREPVRKRENLETLSMVMLDYDFDVKSQIFELDAVFYADALNFWDVTPHSVRATDLSGVVKA